MFRRLFGIARRRSNQAVVDELYGRIVAAARQPHLYEDWGVPDTPLGRFEMMSLHLFLVLHRTRGGSDAVVSVAQELTDTFFLEMDHSLRELGIGDMGVPKRVKKLARMFYGRAQSYGEAIDAGDRAALTAALSRNIRPGEEDWQGAEPLADYATALSAELRAQSDDELLAAGRDSLSRAA